MACFESGTAITLSAREAITLPDVRGATLRITQGTLWLTQEQDRKDVVLRAGDSWVVEADGATVVEAQENVRFWLVGPQGAALRLPGRATHATLWSMLAALFMPPPRHQAPYA
jgi:hypothetical protein